MKENEFSVSEELEQIRTEYAALKERLDRQEIISEKHVLDSIRKDLRVIGAKKWLSIPAGMTALVFLPLVSLDLGLRTPFIVISVVWILSMVTGNLLRERKLDIERLSGESTQVFLTEIKKRKAQQFRWARINMSIFVLWLGYFIGECLRTGIDKAILVPLLTGAAAGAVIGITVGLRIHNRIIGTYEGIILELENLDAPDELVI